SDPEIGNPLVLQSFSTRLGVVPRNMVTTPIYFVCGSVMTPLRGIVRAGMLAVAIVEAGGTLAGQDRQVVRVETATSVAGAAQGQTQMPMSSVDQNGR